MRSLRQRILISISLIPFLTTCATSSDEKTKAPCDSGYEVIDDYKGTVVKIGVPFDTTQEKLKLILQTVADCRQDDPERDYLFSDKLEVWAFLRNGRQTSTRLAGKITRFLPPGNVSQRKKVPVAVRRKRDIYKFSLDDARSSLKPGN